MNNNNDGKIRQQSLSIGIRKRGKLNHLIQLLNEKGIEYDLTEIQDLSTRQMRRKIEELGGNTPQNKNCFESRGKFRDDW